jgi:uncharacterized SAM-binding protein YcdF (DUF218 family)
MLLIIKRLLGQFLSPLPLITLIFLLGWLVRHATRHRRLGLLLQLLSGVLFLAISLGICERPLYNLEQTYPPFDPAPGACESLRGSDIVVLGQGLVPDSDLPIRFRDNDVFRARLTEGARICHWVPESRLLVSMAGEATLADKQAALDEYASLFALSTNRMLMFAEGLDTESEARLALNLARTNTFIIVTSASHLPRAMTLFRKADLAHRGPGTNSGARADFRFTPAPADYRILATGRKYAWNSLPLPGSGGFLQAECLAHETFGRLFEKLRSHLSKTATKLSDK